MAMALYEPGLGYYARGQRLFGAMPASGSDFVTAPELSPLFGRALARQVAQALDAAQRRRGVRVRRRLGRAGGAVAGRAGRPRAALLHRRPVRRAARSARPSGWRACGDARALARRLPEAMHGVVLGNEVLDAMPVQLLHWDGEQWLERGVARTTATAFAWADRATDAAPAGRRPPSCPAR